MPIANIKVKIKAKRIINLKFMGIWKIQMGSTSPLYFFGIWLITHIRVYSIDTQNLRLRNLPHLKLKRIPI